MAWKEKTVLPGFGLGLGFTVTYLSLVVLLPLGALLLYAARLSPAEIWATVSAERVAAAFALSFRASLAGAAINTLLGLMTAWVLVRYRFPGRRVLDALVDLPFALPTAVAGIALTTLLAPTGWVGSHLPFKVAFTELGVIVALTFVSLPFVVRTLQPVLQDLEPEVEEAAASLGATRLQIFTRVIFPALLPALLTGFALAFARALGEYGSVVFISGNLPGKTEIAPLAIMTKLEQFDYAGATAIAVTLLAASFSLLLAINLLQAWTRRRLGGA